MTTTATDRAVSRREPRGARRQHRRLRRCGCLGPLRFSVALAIAGLVAPSTGSAQQGAPRGEWPAYSGDVGSTKYAALGQIDASNVGSLEVAWRWRAQNFGPEPEFNYRTTPIMVDGVLYATAGYRRQVVAIDAANGETLWTYRLDEGERGDFAPRVNSGRGVAGERLTSSGAGG